VGNFTSCYSLRHGDDLFVLDAGRGLAALGYAMQTRAALRGVRRAHVLVSHAHLDHWEGLKDADWFWRRRNGLDVHILGNRQTLRAIKTAYSHPMYVALQLLAAGTVGSVRYRTLEAGERRRFDGWEVETAPLHHYSGEGRSLRTLDTLGFQVTTPDGATVAYLCDHEPNRSTRKVENALLEDAHLAVYDAHFPDIRQHAHGHGSQQHAAGMARKNPDLLVLAGHHGPALADAKIRAAYRRHGRGVPNFDLAVEGATYVWDRRRSAFVRQRQLHDER
jgi:phosphoribosyl 1,2-cyclic phosphodiesterase